MDGGAIRRLERHETESAILKGMQGNVFDEGAFFRDLTKAGVRYLLIGRRALVALGAPVLTGDYALWIELDDTAALNAVASTFELEPNYDPAQAGRRGRYVLEGDERVDVMVARAHTTADGVPLEFRDAFSRKVVVPAYGAAVNLPCLDDLILTKKWGGRPKDAMDIAFLEALRKADR
ncbi:MAG: hypothetical protein HOO96_39235 [Polyangiaceae bacterium]|nr:hypothetical protein [Polyangiaceae bacterium]